MIKLILSLLIIIIPDISFAEITQYSISSGTGFFVNNQNIVTNAHVVKTCKEVTIKGAVTEQKAIVKAVDTEHDLAIIESETPPMSLAPLRFNIDNLQVNDKVLLIGYPGKEGAQGQTKFAISNIIYKPIAPDNKWLYINDVVDHGNSGGPVFDTSGNVIGVVVAKTVLTNKKTLTKIYANSRKEIVNEETLKQSAGVVITLQTLKQFLDNNGIYNESVSSGLVVFDDNYIHQRAKYYIVNVQCRLPAEQVSGVQ